MQDQPHLSCRVKSILNLVNHNEMDIRKISIGADYKSGAILPVGQDVLGGSHSIHLGQADDESYKIWVQKDEEVFMWKEFRKTLPISLEFNIILMESPTDFIVRLTVDTTTLKTLAEWISSQAYLRRIIRHQTDLQL